jgi:hypothetical protein
MKKKTLPKVWAAPNLDPAFLGTSAEEARRTPRPLPISSVFCYFFWITVHINA